MSTPEEIAALKDRLKGAIVMSQPILTNFVRNDRPNPTDPGYEPNSAAYATSVGQRGRGPGVETPQQRAQRLAQALHDAGVGVVLKPSTGEHGTVFVTGRDTGASAYPVVTLSAEHYNMVARMIEQKIAVKLRVNVKTTFHDADGGNAYNVIAELPGTDPRIERRSGDDRRRISTRGTPRRRHRQRRRRGNRARGDADSEAVGAQPRRTIRVALWGGEEEGLFGSKAWVAQHLAGDANRAARDKFDVYFNIDPGTGPIYGFYCRERARESRCSTAGSSRSRTLGAARTSSADRQHRPPELHRRRRSRLQSDSGLRNYDVRIHHTNMDTVERLQENDIRQAAVVIAWFAYQAAMANQKVPRPHAQSRQVASGWWHETATGGWRL